MNKLLKQWKARRELSRLRGDDPTLTHVSFSHLNEAKVREVADVLRSQTHLKSLDLYDLEAGDGGAAAIADIIRVNRSLKKLFIVKGDIGDVGAAAIADALSDNNTLTHLKLMDNDIGADGAKAIAAALSERNESGGRMHTPRIYLNLSWNPIGDDGGRALAAMLRSNTSITRLDLDNCGIEDDGAKAIAAALVANDTIQELFLRYNRIGDVGVKALASALVANDTIEYLFLCKNRIGDDGVKALAAANLLRLRYCDMSLDGNRSIGKEARSAFDLSVRLDQSQPLYRKADVNASDVPAAVALIKQLLPATNFISIPPHKLSAIVATKAAALRSAHPPKPGRLAILDTAQRLIIDHVLAQTRLIPDAAMPLALEKIGGGGDDEKNAIGLRNNNTGINALFEVCIDKPHLFKDAHMNEGMDGQGQGEEEEEETTQKTPQGNTSDKSLRVPAQDMKKRSATDTKGKFLTSFPMCS